MVTQARVRGRKSSLHISVDAELARRLRLVAEKMSIPVSHLSSLALSRAVLQFEIECGASRSLSSVMDPGDRVATGVRGVDDACG